MHTYVTLWKRLLHIVSTFINVFLLILLLVSKESKYFFHQFILHHIKLIPFPPFNIVQSNNVYTTSQVQKLSFYYYS